jgi:hypothetical protein
MERILVLGDSCSGKTTLAARLGERLGVPSVDLDGLFWHRPGWQEPDAEVFRAMVRDWIDGKERWVIAGNYHGRVRDITWAVADTAVWLDFPLRVTVPRMLRRSWARSRSGELLWGTQRELFWPQLKLWSEDSLLGYALRNHRRLRGVFRDAASDPAWTHIRWVRLRNQRDVDRWLATVSAPGSA